MIKKLILFQIIFLLMFTLCKKNPTSSAPEIPEENILASEIPAGDVMGKMIKDNSPYRVGGEITVPDRRTLTIEPGVEVIFQGHFKLNVTGRLLAMGTPDDSITFTAADTDSGWHGIRLNNIPAANDSTILAYCIFQSGKANTGTGLINRAGGAVFTSVSKLRISHCLFRNNLAYDPDVNLTGGGAIAFVGGSPLVEYCDFYANECVFGAVMIIWAGSNCKIQNCHFHHNSGHGTINIGNGSAPLLVNNLIENNYSTQHGHVHFSNASGIAVLINNTIAGNTCVDDGAVYINDNSPHLFINNIIYGNQPGQVYLEVPSGFNMINCLVEGGSVGFSGARFSGRFQNCLVKDPMFLNSDDFHLQNTSPCIGSGIDSVNISSRWYYAPDHDPDLNPRPDPAGSYPDIGAFENPLGSPLTGLN